MPAKTRTHTKSSALTGDSLIAVIGDVHHHIKLAADGLSQIENEAGQSIAQVFSVGDFGLFLHEADWEFLSGPAKYRQPENSSKIRAAWSSWRWPTSMIGGNHEPFHLLRDWNPSAFSGKLEYTNAGELHHGIVGLRVAGLSGIHHPNHMQYLTKEERNHPSYCSANSWPEMVALARDCIISRKRLTYYKQQEVDHLCCLDFTPDLLLLHDWPIPPPHIQETTACRPERKITETLQPRYLCCGHHHTHARFCTRNTEVIALNLITTSMLIHQRKIQSGWAALFRWTGQSLTFERIWP